MNLAGGSNCKVDRDVLDARRPSAPCPVRVAEGYRCGRRQVSAARVPEAATSRSATNRPERTNWAIIGVATSDTLEGSHESPRMKSANALREFTRFLKTRGTSADKVSVRDGIDAMIEFYRSIRADDCSFDSDGDMLLFQWGTYDWGNGPRFELDITRQFIRAAGEDDDIWQLSLTFVFPRNVITGGNRWCTHPAELDDFAAFVQSHPAYVAAADVAPATIELDFEEAG